MPAFTGFVDTVAPTGSSLGYMFPALFVTIACGAISGFHSLVGSGTTAKQLNNEKDAQPIAYGGMLIECVLALVSLCAVAYIWERYKTGEDRHPDRRVCDRPVSRCSARSSALVPCQRHLHADGPGRVRVLPDLSGHRDPSGSLHVPGILAQAR